MGVSLFPPDLLSGGGAGEPGFLKGNAAGFHRSDILSPRRSTVPFVETEVPGETARDALLARVRRLVIDRELRRSSETWTTRGLLCSQTPDVGPSQSYDL